MSLSKLVREEIKHLFDQQGDYGIVVWYDAGGTFSEIVSEVVPSGVKLLRFEGSYLTLRFELEDESPDLTGRWLIYVPEKAPEPQQSWFKDFELLGERLEMDLLAFLQRRFAMAVSSTLIDLFRNRPNNAKDLVSRWEALFGDKKANETELVDALLAIAFGLPRWNFEEALLLFCCEKNWWMRLNERGLWQIWRQRVTEWFNWSDSETPAEEDKLRQKVCSSLLLSELVESEPSLAEKFPFLPPNRQIACRIVREWRDSEKCKMSYQELAREVEDRYGLRGILRVSESLMGVETFPSVEECWISEVKMAVLADGSNFGDKVNRLREIAEKRIRSFWSKQNSEFGNFWETIILATNLWQGCEEAIKTIAELKSTSDFIEKYTCSNGWWQLDLWALQLAAKQSLLNFEDIQRFVRPAWIKFQEYLKAVNRAFANAVEKEGWKSSRYSFWQDIRSSRERTAVFIVDAFRFDLAMYLKRSIEGFVDFEIHPLRSTLPSVTKLGMAALLPEVENLELTWENEKLLVRFKNREVSNVNERKKWLEEFLGERGKVVGLEEIDRMNISDISLLVVLSSELDEFGTFALDIHPQGLFDLVNKLQQAIRYVVKKGFSRIFVITDHGFLFVPQNCEPTSVSPPLSSLEVKRRFAIGGQADNCLMVNACNLGFNGDVLFAFPKGFSVFELHGELRAFLHGGVSLQENIIPMLCGRAKVPVVNNASPKLHVQEPISSRIAIVTITTDTTDPLVQPITVKVRIGKRESERIEVGPRSPKRELSILWLEEFENPPEEATVQLVNAETGEIIEEKRVKIKLLV